MSKGNPTWIGNTQMDPKGSMFKKKESEMGYEDGEKKPKPVSYKVWVDKDKSTLPAEDQIDLLLKDRGSKYGKYDLMAKLACALNEVFYAHIKQYVPAQELFTDSQKVALHMIFLKLSRIANGNINNIDSWVDIAGYAKLAADDIQREQEFNKGIQVPTKKYDHE